MYFERLTTSNLSQKGAADALILKPSLMGLRAPFTSCTAGVGLWSLYQDTSILVKAPLAASHQATQFLLSLTAQWKGNAYWIGTGTRLGLGTGRRLSPPLRAGERNSQVLPAIGNASLCAMAACSAAWCLTQGIPVGSCIRLYMYLRPDDWCSFHHIKPLNSWHGW